jgi:hypothetical protein
MNAFYPGDGQLIFAYGSTLHPAQIAARCQRPDVLAVARLPDHALAFFGHSKIWDGGQETVIAHPGSDVWGVIYRLSYSDTDQLDAWQDVRMDGSGAYFHYPMDVIASTGQSYPVLFYKKDVCGEPRLPSEEYLALIVSGAEAQGLPTDYIGALRKIASQKAHYPVPRPTRFDRSLLAGLACEGCC